MVAQPQLLPVQRYLECNGFLDPAESVPITTRVNGFLDEVTFKEGDEVPRSKILYPIDNREYVALLAKSTSHIEKAEADIANASAQIRLAEAERDRISRAYTHYRSSRVCWRLLARRPQVGRKASQPRASTNDFDERYWAYTSGVGAKSELR